MAKLITIVLPVYNESASLAELFSCLNEMSTQEQNYQFEFIFVDDGSTDDSLQKLIEFKNRDERVTVLELTRNFGKELALTAGLLAATGEAVATLDTDLQHPPGLLAEFLKKWESGAEVVVGIKKQDKGEGWMRGLGAYLFYKIMSAIGDTKIIPYATDYRLIDRKVLEAFKEFTEHQRITRGLIEWLGFKTEYIYFDCEPRHGGNSPGYGFFKLLRLAVSTFTAHSLLPLRLAGYLGVTITFFSGLFGLFILVENFFWHDPWKLSFSGPAMLAVLVIFLVGIVLISLGLMALYIGQIHSEVINRPLYVVRKKYD